MSKQLTLEQIDAEEDFIPRTPERNAQVEEFVDSLAQKMAQKFGLRTAEAPAFVEIRAASVGEIRTATYDGSEHLVVPVVALVEGVIHAVNAPSAELVLAEEFSQGWQGWNGRPVCVDHPMRHGTQVSANHPTVLEEESIGTVFNARLSGKRLLMEAWINKARAARTEKGRALLARAEKGQPIEVSVGTWVTAEAKPGSFGPRAYKSIWRRIVPDHLALLSDGHTGACSIEMGCGAFRPAEQAAPRYAYSDDQPRDKDGKWTDASGGGGGSDSGGKADVKWTTPKVDAKGGLTFSKTKDGEKPSAWQRIREKLSSERGGELSAADVAKLGAGVTVAVESAVLLSQIKAGEIALMMHHKLGDEPERVIVDGIHIVEKALEVITHTWPVAARLIGAEGQLITAEAHPAIEQLRKVAAAMDKFEPEKGAPIHDRWAATRDVIDALLDAYGGEGRAAQDARFAELARLATLDGEASADKEEHPFTYCMEHVVPAIEAKNGPMEDAKAFCGWWKGQRMAKTATEQEPQRKEPTASDLVTASSATRLVTMQEVRSMLDQANDALGRATDMLDAAIADEDGEEPGANLTPEQVMALAIAHELAMTRIRMVVARCEQATGLICGAKGLAYEVWGVAVPSTSAERPAYLEKADEDKESAQAMHDRAVAMGAECGPKAAEAKEPNMATSCGCKKAAEGARAMNKNERITALISNPATPWDAADQAYLEGLSDERLTALEANAAAQAAPKADEKAEEKTVERVAEEKVETKPLTEEEYLATAPDSIKQIVSDYKAAQARRKQELVGSLKTAQAEYTEAELGAMDVPQLERLARVAKAAEPAVDNSGRGLPRAASEKETVPPPIDMTERIRALRSK